MSVNVYELVAQVVEQKVQNPSADVRQTVLAALEQANASTREVLLDALNLLDAIGSFVGVHYSMISGDGATELAARILDDVRFLGIISDDGDA